MASSGNFETKIAGGSSGGYYVGVDWVVNSQSTANVSSNVTAKVYIRSSGSGYTISSSTSKNITVTINGTQYSGTNTIGIGTNSKKYLLDKTVDVKHNSDGTKACALACSVYIGFTLSGTSLSTVYSSGTAYFDNITVNTPPTMGGSLNLSPGGIFPETTSSLTLSWSKASDSQGNADKYQIYRYVNGTHDKVIDVGNINTLSTSDGTIGSLPEGSKIYYKIWAGDSYGTWSNELTSGTSTKNIFTPASITSISISKILWGTNEFNINVGGASNSGGDPAFTYVYFSNDVTVYNNSAISSTTGTIKIWRDLDGGTQPSGMSIKQSALRDRLKDSNYAGSIHIGVKTINSNRTEKQNSSSLEVDLKTDIKVSGTTTINANSYYTISGTNYLIPNRKQITLNWPAATDPLGTVVKYKIEQQVNGGTWTTYLNEATGTSHSFNLTVSGKPTYNFRVIASNGYGRTATISGTPGGVMYSYSAPSVRVTSSSRASTSFLVNFSASISTEITNNIKSIKWTFGAKTGTLNTTDRTFTITGLNEGDSGEFTITIEDTIGASVGQAAETVRGAVPQFYPIMSIRKNGIGVRCVPDGSSELKVNGLTATKNMNIFGVATPNTGTDNYNRWTKIAEIRMTGQYEDAGFTALMTGAGNGSDNSTSGRIVVRMKQQNSLGQAPGGSIYLYDAQMTNSDCFKIVVTKNTATETLGEVWFKNQVYYESVWFSLLRKHGNVVMMENSPYVTALPQGLQLSCIEPKPTPGQIGALPTTGGEISGAITMPGSSQQWIGGAKGAGCILNMTSASGYSPFIRQKAQTGAWTFGTYTSDTYHLTYMPDSSIDAGNNTVHTQYQFPTIGKFVQVLGTDTNGYLSRNRITLDSGSAMAQDGLFITGSGGPVMNLWAGTGGAVIMTTGNHNLHLGRNSSTTDIIIYDYNVTFNKPINAVQTVYSNDFQYQSSSGWNGTWGLAFQCHIMPTTSSRYCGTGSYRWEGMYSKTNLNVSSDRSLKENIRYIEDNNKLKTYSLDNLTSFDFHTFIKEDLKIATYDYIIPADTLELDDEGQQEMIRNMHHEQIGFIAQDIVDTKVGSKIITRDENGLLSYETGNYTTVIAGALQEEIRVRELEIKQLKIVNDNLMKELELIKSHLGI